MRYYAKTSMVNIIVQDKKKRPTKVGRFHIAKKYYSSSLCSSSYFLMISLWTSAETC